MLLVAGWTFPPKSRPIPGLSRWVEAHQRMEPMSSTLETPPAFPAPSRYLALLPVRSADVGHAITYNDLAAAHGVGRVLRLSQYNASSSPTITAQNTRASVRVIGVFSVVARLLPCAALPSDYEQSSAGCSCGSSLVLRRRYCACANSMVHGSRSVGMRGFAGCVRRYAGGSGASRPSSSLMPV